MAVLDILYKLLIKYLFKTHKPTYFIDTRRHIEFAGTIPIR